MSRRDEVREDLGLTTEEERQQSDVAIQHEEQRRQKKEQAKQILENEPSYKLVKGIATVFDKYCVDGLLGFFLPEMGDIVTSFATLPYLYVSLFKIKSIPLTLSILYNMMIDCLIGLVPWIGDLLDFFHRSYSKSYTLIVGYVEDDEEIIRKVRQDSWKSLILIALMVLMCYLLYSAISGMISTIYGIFGCAGN